MDAPVEPETGGRSVGSRLFIPTPLTPNLAIDATG